jgi:hypothetical protein
MHLRSDIIPTVRQLFAPPSVFRPGVVPMNRQVRWKAWIALIVSVAGCAPSAPTPSAPPASPPLTAEPTPSGTSPNDSTSSSTPAETPEPEAAQPAAAELGSYPTRDGKEVFPTPDFVAEPQALYEEQIADNAAFKAKYTDKVVEMQGTIAYYVSGVGRPALNLVAGDISKGQTKTVTMAQDHPWLQWPPGSQVVVRTKFMRGFGREFDLGYIVGGEPAALPEATVADVAAKFKENREAFIAEHKGKFLKLTGVVAAESKAEDEYTMIASLGDANAPVLLKLGPGEAVHARKWRPGDEVVVLAMVSPNENDERLTFVRTLVVSPLPEYPPWPGLVDRDGGKYRSFSADLLGRWMADCPSALDAGLHDSDDPRLEVEGSVDEVAEVETSIGKETHVKLKNAAGAHVALALSDERLKELALAPGNHLVARGGTLVISTSGCVLNSPDVEKRKK